MSDIDLGALEHAPHARLIRDMANRCGADCSIQAIWVGGSLAAGYGDAFSDIDFRIAVESGQVDEWTSPNWERYLPIHPCGGLLMRFGERALLHHFGTLKAIERASLADLTKVPGINEDTARRIYEYFR